MWVVELSDKPGLPCGEVQSRGAPCSEQGWACPQTGTPGLGQLGLPRPRCRSAAPAHPQAQTVDLL